MASPAYQLTVVTTEADWEIYHRIRRVVLFEGLNLPSTYDPDNPDEHHPNNTPLLLKQDGAGVATVRFDLLGNSVAAIRLVAVDHQYQGQGVGRILGEKLAEFAVKKQVKKLVVNSDPASIGFYERLGFYKEEWDPTELRSIAADCIQMVKELDF